MTPTRWGICAAGRISHDFSLALRILPRKDHQLVAIGSRNLERAKEYAKKFEIPKVYGSYEELANDPEIDVVYVGSANAAHIEHCKLMLNAGKHVLCEAPLAINTREVKEILELAKQKQLFLMEGYWGMFFPGMHELRKQLDSGIIGDVVALTGDLGMELKAKSHTSLEPGGGNLMMLGYYSLTFSQFLFKDYPSKISASGHLAETGVDLCSTISLLYDKRRIATLSTSMACLYNNTGMVYGTKGMIELPYYWHPCKLILPNETLEYPLPESKDGPPIYTFSTGLCYEAEAVRQCLLRGDTESDQVPHSMSLTLSEIRDSVREQLGLVYEADKTPQS